MKERNRLFPSKSKLAPSSPTTPLSVRADSALARCGRVVATPESRSKRVAQVQGKVLLFQTPTSKKILCTEIGDRGETASSKQLCGGAGEGCSCEGSRTQKDLGGEGAQGSETWKTSPSVCPKAVRPKDVAEQKKSGDLRVRGAILAKHVPEKKVESARVRAATQTSGMRSKPADRPAQRKIATQGLVKSCGWRSCATRRGSNHTSSAVATFVSWAPCSDTHECESKYSHRWAVTTFVSGTCTSRDTHKSSSRDTVRCVEDSARSTSACASACGICKKKRFARPLRRELGRRQATAKLV